MNFMSHYARNYSNQPKSSSLFPSLTFYAKAFTTVALASVAANKNQYPVERWIRDSFAIGQAIENVGTKIIIDGYENIEALDGPCVFMSNHMSTLETFFLPVIIQPTRDVTFVVKDSLLKYPGLGAVLRSRNPIGVTRTNPREDLAKVMREGVEHLQSGRSMIIFSQGTRYDTVNPEDFSTLAVKLAKKANVPMIPIALKTDAWGTGKRIKDIGVIDPKKTVHIRFGEAMDITGNGKDEHVKALDFIVKNFQEFCHD